MSTKWTALVGLVCLLPLALPDGLAAQEGYGEEKKVDPKAVVERCDARLRPVEAVGFGRPPTAKLEWRRFGSGDASLEVEIRDLPVESARGTDREEIDLVIRGRTVATLEVRNQRARLKLESRRGATVPAVEPGDAVELRQHGLVIMRGEFRAR